MNGHSTFIADFIGHISSELLFYMQLSLVYVCT